MELLSLCDLRYFYSAIIYLCGLCGVKSGWIWEIIESWVSPQTLLWDLCQHRHWDQRCRVSSSDLENFFWPHCWKRKYRGKTLLKFRWITLARKGMSMLYPHIANVEQKNLRMALKILFCVPVNHCGLKYWRLVWKRLLKKSKLLSQWKHYHLTKQTRCAQQWTSENPLTSHYPTV